MAVKEEERILPLLPLRGLIVFPTMVLHLDVGRERSVRALEKAMVDDHNLILLATQREVHIEEPTQEEIYQVGTVAKVRQMLKLPNGTIRVLVEGLKRARIEEYVGDDECYIVRYRELEGQEEGGQDIEALMRAVLDHFEQYLRLSKKLSPEIYSVVVDIEEPGRL
ncbi:MAG: LON peptidase substrate-binding domain-containing protein, partial [Thermoactinomyces sp.]